MSLLAQSLKKLLILIDRIHSPVEFGQRLRLRPVIPVLWCDVVEVSAGLTKLSSSSFPSLAKGSGKLDLDLCSGFLDLSPKLSDIRQSYVLEYIPPDISTFIGPFANRR